MVCRRVGAVLFSMSAPIVGGASSISVYTNVYAGTPRSAFAATPFRSPRGISAATPALSVPHMQHHSGYGWGEHSSKGMLPRNTSWQRHGERSHEAQGLGVSPHPYMKPSQRDHGNVLDAGLPDTLPPRASRKPTAHPHIKPHDAHVLSWPGTGLHVPSNQHYFKPQVDSRHEIRGELPPTAQLLISAGSRPGFPTCAQSDPAPARRTPRLARQISRCFVRY